MRINNLPKKVWILTGNEENWEIAVRDKIWGVREGRLKSYWDKLEKGDLLLFYTKSPIGGLIGLGLVDSKFKQDKPLWPDEIREKRVIYPYRFGFNIIYYLPDSWQEKNINVADLKLPFQAGMNPLNREDAINEILKRAKEKWNVELPVFVRGGIKQERIKEGSNLHNEIRDKLYSIGQVENFISEKEYPLDGERLDVTWRRVVRGVPTRVFEVQIGGSIHQAISKLKHAWDLWNSEPFLIIEPQQKQKAEELLSGTFHEIQKVLKIITIDKVEELYDYLISSRKLKEEFGL
jgi:predicted RNA-binding protein